MREIKRSPGFSERVAGRFLGVATAFASCFALISCGGENAGPRPGADLGGDAGSDPCAADDAYELQPVSDFETGIADGFYTNNDLSVGHTMDPPAGASSPEATEIPDLRCGESRYALRIAAEGLADWGAVFGRNFSAPIDMSKFDGLSMWVRRGAQPGRTLFAGITEKHTDEKSGFCSAVPEVPTDACDRFGAGLGLEEAWRFVVIPFAAMKQQGFGKPAPSIDLVGVIGLNFSFGPGAWEIWIDDVSQYREP